MYSRSKLRNSNAESGTLEYWEYLNVAVVPGGQEDSTFCFQIASTGSMKQSVSSNTQPPDVKVGGFFLPEYPTTEPEKKVFMKVIHHYGDNSKDEHLIPCVEAAGGVVEEVTV
ncbi:hypothetical protein [Dehalobacterium formicoaceticum]|uniref:hypothetical protein n=1 Tax=Dehalobacterium formicoaceticum TaxID=51515 RepID=UPI0012F7C6FC|nr:hypothetical protein [Dehalobacterium formicoaceticum]